MKINFTKKEYRLLIDMVYLADWMLTSHDEVTDPVKEAYEMLTQKIYSCAKEMGCESLIEGSKETDEYYTTLEYEMESGIHDYVDEYNSESFWEELIHRLVERDVEAESNREQNEIDSPEAFWAIAGPIGEEYTKEFESNGLDRLIVSET